MQVVADQFGCTDTARLSLKILTVVNDITELIPNVISPNGDGLNDIWRLDFIDIYYPKAEIEIYNRWGQKLFQSTGYSNAWDGTYKGDALPAGTYFFIIDLKDPDKPDLYKGTILLMK
jgi:gliding motility-associated-like protein